MSYTFLNIIQLHIIPTAYDIFPRFVSPQCCISLNFKIPLCLLLSFSHILSQLRGSFYFPRLLFPSRFPFRKPFFFFFFIIFPLHTRSHYRHFFHIVRSRKPFCPRVVGFLFFSPFEFFAGFFFKLFFDVVFLISSVGSYQITRMA